MCISFCIINIFWNTHILFKYLYIILFSNKKKMYTLVCSLTIKMFFFFIKETTISPPNICCWVFKTFSYNKTHETHETHETYAIVSTLFKRYFFVKKCLLFFLHRHHLCKLSFNNSLKDQGWILHSTRQYFIILTNVALQRKSNECQTAKIIPRPNQQKIFPYYLTRVPVYLRSAVFLQGGSWPWMHI